MAQTEGGPGPGPGGGGPGSGGLAGRAAAATTTAAPWSSGRHDDGAVALADGDPEASRLYEAGVASGVVPAPKGPKPLIGGPAVGGVAPSDEGDRGGSGDAGRDGADGPGSTASAAGRVDWGPAPTGPATPEDAWKWEGVPPGRGLIGKVEAGKMRYYMGDDGHGPVIRWLPPAWPPGHQGEGG